MAVTIIHRSDQVDGKHDQIHQVIEDVSRVNAVAGLKEGILQQERRVAKLRRHENRLPSLLSELSNEMRLLDTMYANVIKFQTSAAVLAHMGQDGNSDALIDEVTDLSMDIANKGEIHTATMKALALLNKVK